MSWEEGDGGQQVPSAVIEVEVETSPMNCDCEHSEQDEPEQDNNNNNTHRKDRKPKVLRPPFPRFRVPFETSREFGNWLYCQLEPSAFFKIHLKFMRYCKNFNIKKLVRFGKLLFHHVERLYYLEGLLMVAVTEKQKLYIQRIFQMEERRVGRYGLTQ